MTKIKFCGLFRPDDIEAANELCPDYIGFVFAPASRRYVSPELARALKQRLKESIEAVGVFVDEKPEQVAELLNSGTIDIAQLHGNEDEAYITQLRGLTDKKIIKAFRISKEEDLQAAKESRADFILLDSGQGTGKTFDWSLIKGLNRPFFLAGGLSPDTVEKALKTLAPYAVDVSSGIETEGTKDKAKMAAFAAAVKEADSYKNTPVTSKEAQHD